MADDLRFPFPEIAHLALAEENRRYAIERNDLRAFQRSGIDPGRHIVIHAVAQPECRPVVRDIRNYRALKAGLGERLLQNDVFSVKRRKLLLCYVGNKSRPGAERFILRHQPDGDIIAVGENAFRLKLQPDRFPLRHWGQELRAELFQRLPPFGEHAFAALLPFVQPKAGIDHGNSGGFDRHGEYSLFPHEVRQRIDIIAPLYRVGLIADGSTHILVEPADSLLGVVPVKGALVLEFQVLRRVVSPDACAPGTHAFTPLSA